jgi:homoisocitrate dehydrogenase
MELCVIEGDGVGHEVIPAAVRVLKSLVPELQLFPAEAGFECLLTNGTPLPSKTVELAERCRAVLFGAAESPSYIVEGYYSPIIALRQRLKAYANVRPTRYLPVATARPGVDMIIVRENTEDLYTGSETLSEGGDRSTAEKIVTRAASERVSYRTYRLAQANGRKRVTIVHKANVLPKSDGLFRRVAMEVAEQYPDIETDELLVDTAAYWMVKSPGRFDVILTSNLYGDILSDMGAAWGGGLGLAPALNLGDDAAIAEPVHGTAPDIAGKGIANPTAAILSVALLLRHHWGRLDLAERIEFAITKAITDGYHTFDIDTKDAVGTEAFTEKVLGILHGTADAA